jgi:lipoate-protein ligase A
LCPLVRRASGGGAIVHDRELTYSIAWPMRDTRTQAATNLYDACHETLVEVLAAKAVRAAICRPPPDACITGSQARESLPPFLCFQRRSCGDILCGEHKVVGSAQRRSRGAVLQHGSILLSRSSCAPELPGIRELTTQSLEIPELIESWVICLSRRLCVDLCNGALSTREAASAREFCESRFANETYNSRR